MYGSTMMLSVPTRTTSKNIDTIPSFSKIATYTPGGFVLGDRPFYLVKWLQEKSACDFHDDATPLSFQLQVTEDFF